MYAYASFLLVYCLYTMGFNLIAVADIENYCGTVSTDPECEDSQAAVGITVLFIYQAIQMVLMWGVWSMYKQCVGSEEVHMAGEAVIAGKPVTAAKYGGGGGGGYDPQSFGQEMAALAGESTGAPHRRRRHRESIAPGAVR